MDDSLNLFKYNKETKLVGIATEKNNYQFDKKEILSNTLDRVDKSEEIKSNAFGVYNINAKMRKYLYKPENDDAYGRFSQKINKFEMLSDPEQIKEAIPSRYMGVTGYRKAGTRAGYAKKAAAGYKVVKKEMAELAIMENNGFVIQDGAQYKRGTEEFEKAVLNEKIRFFDLRLEAMMNSAKVSAADKYDEASKLAMARLKINACKINCYKEFMNSDAGFGSEEYSNKIDVLEKQIASDRAIIGKSAKKATGYANREELYMANFKKYNSGAAAQEKAAQKKVEKKTEKKTEKKKLGYSEMTREEWLACSNMTRWARNRKSKGTPYVDDKGKYRISKEVLDASNGCTVESYWERCVSGFLSKDARPTPEVKKADQQYLDAVCLGDLDAMEKFSEQIARGIGECTIDLDTMLNAVFSGDVTKIALADNQLKWYLFFTKTAENAYYKGGSDGNNGICKGVPKQLQNLANLKSDVLMVLTNIVAQTLQMKGMKDSGLLAERKSAKDVKRIETIIVGLRAVYEEKKKKYIETAKKKKNLKLLDENGNLTDKTLGQAYPEFFDFNVKLTKEITLKPFATD